MNFPGLAVVNIELTSRCNKNCWMCGRRKIDRDYPEIAMNYGDMDFRLVRDISKQLPPNITVQFHNNGEPLLYELFGPAVSLFPNQIKCVDTNGKLLVDKAAQIIGNLDTITISVIQDDPEADEQYEIIKEFLKLKGDMKPYVILRLNGNVDRKRYDELECLVATRILHAKMGSFDYKKRPPTIPEAGICWDFLNHMSINKDGEVSICVRFDPLKAGVIGDANTERLEDIWNGEKRMEWLEYHKQGRRDKVPLCSYCEFWGIPTGYE